MKRQTIGVFASLVVAAALISTQVAAQTGQAGQAQAQAAAQVQKPAEVTLTGCLIQGSSPAVFIFENAKKDAKSTTEKGVSYIVVATSGDMNLRGITGEDLLHRPE